MDERVNKWKICIFIIFFISFINPAFALYTSQTVVEWVEKGNVLYDSGEYNKAIEAYNKALAIDPNDNYAWDGKGSAFYELGEYENAIEAFNRVIIIDPNYEKVKLKRSLAYQKMGEQMTSRMSEGEVNYWIRIFGISALILIGFILILIGINKNTG